LFILVNQTNFGVKSKVLIKCYDIGYGTF